MWSEWSLLWLVAAGCGPASSVKRDTGSDTAPGPDTGDDTGETGTEPGPGVVVLAGGGSEGDSGDAGAWSARLYGALLEGGDVTGDGLLRVAVVSAAEETDWLPEYFQWLGADEAVNFVAADPATADGRCVPGTFAEVDAVFLKGGDQGLYYDAWNDTALEEAILGVWRRGGGIGGTSAGAMSLAGHALAGGQDLVSLDVLEDACTPWLDDASDGGSGIHDDFLGVLPGMLVDTHFTERARLGRLVGALARVVDEGALATILGVGLEQRTGLVVRGDRATVVGEGSVAFVGPGSASQLRRTCGSPLVWTDLRLDVLTDGWTFDLATGAPDTTAAPAGAEAVAWDGVAAANAGAWSVDGDLLAHRERFARVVDLLPNPFGTHAGTDPPVLEDGLGFPDAHDGDRRGWVQEAAFRALHDHVGMTAYLVARGGRLERDEARPAEVRFRPNTAVPDPEAATLVVASHGVTHRSVAAGPSAYDGGDGSLHAAALTGLALHVLASGDLAWDAEARAVVPAR